MTKNAYGRKFPGLVFSTQVYRLLKKSLSTYVEFFLCYVNVSIRSFGGSVSCPELYGMLYRQNLPYKFKKSYGDFLNRNFKNSHRTTGPRSDLRPDL